MAVCTNHTGTETYLSCSACERPFCFNCLTQMAVGQKCLHCAKGIAPKASGQLPGRAETKVLLAKKDRHIALKATFQLLLGPVRFAARASRIQNGEGWRLLTGAVGFANLPTAAFGLGLSWWLGRFLELKLGHVRLALLALVGIASGLAACLVAQPDANNFAALGMAGAFVGAYGAGLMLRQLPRLRLPNVGYGWLLGIFFLGSSVIRALSDTGTLIVLVVSAAVGFVFGRIALSDLTTMSQTNQRIALAVSFAALATFSAARASQVTITKPDANAELVSALDDIVGAVTDPSSYDRGWLRVTYWEDELDGGDAQSYQLQCDPSPRDKPQASGFGFNWIASNASGACAWLATAKVPDRGELRDSCVSPDSSPQLMSRVQLTGDLGSRTIDVAIRTSGCPGEAASAADLFFPDDDRTAPSTVPPTRASTTAITTPS
jgi:Rhomboid family